MCDGGQEQPPPALPRWSRLPAKPCVAALAHSLLRCLLEASRLWRLFPITQHSQGWSVSLVHRPFRGRAPWATQSTECPCRELRFHLWEDEIACGRRAGCGCRCRQDLSRRQVPADVSRSAGCAPRTLASGCVSLGESSFRPAGERAPASARASAVCDEALLGLRAPPGAGAPPWGACVGSACPPGGPFLGFLAAILLRVGPVSDT